MKLSKTCPKCRATDVVRIPGTAGAFGAGNNISVGRTVFSSVTVTRYLCGACGFSEEWIDDPAEIGKVKAKFA